MIEHKKFISLEVLNHFIKVNDIKREDIISSEKKVEHYTKTRPAVDWSGGRNIYFEEGSTETVHYQKEWWELTYYK